MTSLKYLTLSILSVLFVFSSCTSEGETKEKPLTADQLNGHWDLTSATRDGDLTSSLAGTFMEFSDGKLSCNFTGEVVNSAFSFENRQFTHENQSYKIESITPSEMVVSTQFMDFDFKLTFNKTP